MLFCICCHLQQRKAKMTIDRSHLEKLGIGYENILIKECFKTVSIVEVNAAHYILVYISIYM